jgi:hypothetical protein
MNTGQRYFGMSIVQIGILAVLAFVACIAIGFLGIMLLGSVPATPQIQPTYTLQPSPTIVVTSTAWPTITPIPDWQEYTFADGRARIWLPASYVGGDTVTSAGNIMEQVKNTSDDEAFVSGIQELIATPEIAFFAFDTADSTSVLRFMYVGMETVSPDLVLTIDDYLNRIMDESAKSGDRVVERQVTQMDYYPAGKLVVEHKISTEDVDVYVTMAAYVVQVDDTMWFMTFRTGREEFGNYRPIMEASANSFWIQR